MQIFRPRIIVGERESGWTASFNVLYPPLKAFQAGAYPALPARGSTPVDVVPVDFVADAVFELAGEPAESGEVHHLWQGSGRPPSGAWRSWPPPTSSGAGRGFCIRSSTAASCTRCSCAPHGDAAARALERTEALFPYFAMKVRFDNRRTRARLRRAGLEAPSVDGYLDRLLDFAVASRWGREPLSRVEARRRLCVG